MKFELKKQEDNVVPSETILHWLSLARESFSRDKTRDFFTMSDGICTIVVQRTFEYGILDVSKNHPMPVIEFIVNQNGIKSVSIPEDELATAELTF